MNLQSLLSIFHRSMTLVLSDLRASTKDQFGGNEIASTITIGKVMGTIFTRNLDCRIYPCFPLTIRQSSDLLIVVKRDSLSILEMSRKLLSPLHGVRKRFDGSTNLISQIVFKSIESKLPIGINHAGESVACSRRTPALNKSKLYLYSSILYMF